MSNLKRRKLENWLRKRNHRAKTVKADEIKTQNLKRWEEDYQLQDGGRLALFQEYLEMGIYVRSFVGPKFAHALS
jgi:hypothetical protein